MPSYSDPKEIADDAYLMDARLLYAVHARTVIVDCLCRPFTEAAACNMAFQHFFYKPTKWQLDSLDHAPISFFNFFRRYAGIFEAKDRTAEELGNTKVVLPKNSRLIAGSDHDNRRVRDVMTPRNRVKWIDIRASDDQVRTVLERTQHSLLPVGDGTPDRMLGIVRKRELLSQMLSERPLDIRTILRTAPQTPDAAEVSDVSTALGCSDVQMALVRNEYGHLDGIVTPTDLLKSVGYRFQTDAYEASSAILRTEDGTWLIAGSLSAEVMARHLQIKLAEPRGFTTAAGYVVAKLRRLPTLGEQIAIENWQFIVSELDCQRISQLTVTSLRGKTKLAQQLASKQTRLRASYKDGRTLFVCRYPRDAYIYAHH